MAVIPVIPCGVNNDKKQIFLQDRAWISSRRKSSLTNYSCQTCCSLFHNKTSELDFFADRTQPIKIEQNRNLTNQQARKLTNDGLKIYIYNIQSPLIDAIDKF